MSEDIVPLARIEWKPTWSLNGKAVATVGRSSTGVVYTAAFNTDMTELEWSRVPEWVKLALQHMHATALGIGS